jgi:hypothetical protein
MLRNILYVLLGLILGPFIWLFTKLGALTPSPPKPKAIEDFGNYLWSNGLRASVSLQDVRVNHAEHLAQLQFGLNPSQMKVVTLAVAATPEAAELLEREIINAPQYTGVRRNGTLVMACTFAPPDPELEGRVTTAFSSYRGRAI